MRVILPDSSELELPEGATGLDAAAAIGPKLAKEAVLVRANGRVQDVRLPLEDGQPIQILTTRDTEDPDALYVLRHSAAHLLAEAVRRLYPGTKIAIGPPIENGFYYDFEFPEPIGEEALEKIEAEIQRELKEGRSWERQEVAADEAKRLFAEQGEDYKVELVDTAEGDISLYTQGDFTDLCRGPHLQDSKPIKAIKLTGLAGAYWRGDENNTQLTRIYGTAFYSQADLDAYLERIEEAKKRDHRRLGVQLDLVHFDEHSPGSPLWHPKGMVIWNELEKIRKRENDKRGYLEVKTPIIYNEETFITSGHFPTYEDLMFKLEVRRSPLGDEGDELPRAHAALRQQAAFLPRAAAAVRRAGAPAPQRDHGHAARPAPRPARHAGRRAHLRQPGSDSGRDRRGRRLRELPLRPVRNDGFRRAGDPPGQEDRDGRAVGHDGGCARGGAEAQRDPVRDRRGRGRVLRAEDRPLHG